MHQTLRKRMPAFFPVELITRGVVRDLVKGETLFHQGDPVHSLLFVLEGELKAVRTDTQGTECVMLRASGGEFFAEAALASDQYVCDGIAIRSTRVVAFPVELVREALRSEGDFAYAFFSLVAKQARRQCSRQERLRLKLARDRVIHYLTCEAPPGAPIKLDVPLREWACELALEPETLYRTLSDLEREGRLERDGRQIQLIY